MTHSNSRAMCGSVGEISDHSVGRGHGVISLFSGLFTVPLYTLMQVRSERSHRSRVIAANNILNALFMVVSSVLLLELLRLKLTSPQLFLILGGLNALFTVLLCVAQPEFAWLFSAWSRACVTSALGKIRGRGGS